MPGARGPVRESDLYRVWESGSLTGRKLFTLDRHRLEILEQGIRNFDAGPDFLDALIRFDGEMIRGDIEIHSRTADWYLHRHDTDPRYNRVILHVVARAGPAELAARRQNGSTIPALLLDSAFFQKTPIRSPACLPPTASPGWKCPLAERTSTGLIALIESMGYNRLMMHSDQFAEMRDVTSWEQIFFSGLLDALGYGKNQIPFRRLAWLLPIETIRALIRGRSAGDASLWCEALLFGAAGLLPVETHRDEHVRGLQARWQTATASLSIEPMRTEEWQFFRLRPGNFPTRRIAAAAALISRFSDAGFLASFRALITAARGDRDQAIGALRGLFIITAGGYWSTHYDFATTHPAGTGGGARLIGSGRSGEMVINVVLPGLLAWARESEDGHLAAALRSIYLAYPCLPENSITRLMQQQLLRPHGLAKTGQRLCAIHQQGLIQLYKTRCRRGSCAECMAAAPGNGYPFC
jgi:hypothetical protein